MSREIDQKQAKAYREHAQKLAPKSNVLLHCIKAFLVGGLICVVGQGVADFGKGILQLSKDNIGAFTAIVMVFLGATLTGLGVYDRIGKFAGAGSIIPITGFANSVVSPAMEFKSEGFVMGTGAKLFALAGPVLVNGYTVSVLFGILLCILGRAGGGG